MFRFTFANCKVKRIWLQSGEKHYCTSSGHHVTAACVFVLKLGRYNDMDFHFPLLFICDPICF